MILAGDVGGTNARFCLYEGGRAVRQATLPSKEQPSCEAALRAFLEQGDRSKERVDAACIGVAGPVVDGRCEATNLPWVIDARVLAAELGTTKVALINDLQALALGTQTVDPAKLLLLNGTKVPRSSGTNLAVIAAGTGLGEAMLVWDGLRHVASATEGGHTDFAPRDGLEVELLEYLKERIKGRVSYERVLSGPGIGNLYDFFRETRSVPERPELEREIAESPDRNATISKLGLAGSSAAANQALDLFVSLYGAEAGNLVLKAMATGGIYLVGGISNRLADRLQQGSFLRSFTDKGRLRHLLEAAPVALVRDTDIGLAGSANHAVTL